MFNQIQHRNYISCHIDRDMKTINPESLDLTCKFKIKIVSKQRKTHLTFHLQIAKQESYTNLDKPYSLCSGGKKMYQL